MSLQLVFWNEIKDTNYLIMRWFRVSLMNSQLEKVSLYVAKSRSSGVVLFRRYQGDTNNTSRSSTFIPSTLSLAIATGCRAFHSPSQESLILQWLACSLPSASGCVGSCKCAFEGTFLLLHTHMRKLRELYVFFPPFYTGCCGSLRF